VPVAYAQDKLRIEDPEQEAKPVQVYQAKAKPAYVKVKSIPTPSNSPEVAPAAPSYKASQSVPVPTYKSPASASTSSYESPAPAPAYKAPASTATYEAPAPAPSYKAPVSTLEAAAPAPAYKAPVATPAYVAPAPAPAYKDPVSTYEAAAPAPAYKAPATKPIKTFYGSQSIDLFSDTTKINPFFKENPTKKPISTYKSSISYKPSKPNKPIKTYKPSTTFAPSTTYKPVTTPTTIKYSSTPKYVSTAAPFYGSPSPSSFTGSPTPSIYQSSPGYFVQPSYKPSTYFRSTNKPFTAFIGSPEPASKISEASPIKKIQASPKFVENNPKIELEQEFKKDSEVGSDTEDGEVFYIFYENEENPLDSVKSGLDLQRYIHEEIQKSQDDSAFSASEREAEIYEDTANNIVEPVFSIVEEFNKPKQPVYFDVPIKIEENGEGFDPPSEIRTIYVPVENAINVPEIFDISVGTSFGYNKNSKDSFPNFSSDSESSYNNPISSYDAPIAPFNKDSSFSDLSAGKDSVDLNEFPDKKSVRRVRKPKPKSFGKFSYDPVESSLSSIPYGTRLGPRDQYDPLIIKR